MCYERMNCFQRSHHHEDILSQSHDLLTSLLFHQDRMFMLSIVFPHPHVVYSLTLMLYIVFPHPYVVYSLTLMLYIAFPHPHVVYSIRAATAK